MKIFAGIIGNKVNVGLLAELEASRADLDWTHFPSTTEWFEMDRIWGQEDTFREGNLGRDVA